MLETDINTLTFYEISTLYIFLKKILLYVSSGILVPQLRYYT